MCTCYQFKIAYSPFQVNNTEKKSHSIHVNPKFVAQKGPATPTTIKKPPPSVDRIDTILSGQSKTRSVVQDKVPPRRVYPNQQRATTTTPPPSNQGLSVDSTLPVVTSTPTILQPMSSEMAAVIQIQLQLQQQTAQIMNEAAQQVQQQKFGFQEQVQLIDLMQRLNQFQQLAQPTLQSLQLQTQILQTISNLLHSPQPSVVPPNPEAELINNLLQSALTQAPAPTPTTFVNIPMGFPPNTILPASPYVQPPSVPIVVPTPTEVMGYLKPPVTYPVGTKLHSYHHLTH